MTTLTYGGITLQNCTIKVLDEEVVYDESNTDHIGHKFRVCVVGYIHQAPTPNTILAGIDKPPTALPQQGTPIATYKFARKKLMEPRKELILRFSGVEVLRAFATWNPASVTTGRGDINNGPKPIACNRVHHAGAKSIKIEYEIETTIVDCDNNRNTSGVLSNRWSTRDFFEVSRIRF